MQSANQAHSTNPTMNTEQQSMNVKTTSQRAAIQATETGPALYVGGAPLPHSAITKPTPDVIQKERDIENRDQAELNKIQAQETHDAHKDGKLTDKMKSTLHVAQAKMGAKSADKQLKTDEKKFEKADTANKKKFQTLFPDVVDDVMACFTCKYIDGKSETSTGFLMVSNTNLCYAGDKGDPTREVIPYKTIASVEEVGKPVRINVYTVDKKVYQFTDVQMGQEGMADDSPHAAAMNWIDHRWRSVAQVPNPAATYFSS